MCITYVCKNCEKNEKSNAEKEDVSTPVVKVPKLKPGIILPIALLLFLLLSCSSSDLAPSSEEKRIDSLHAEDYYGEWVALKYIAGSQIQSKDFSPEKFIGNRIIIKENSYFMSHWEGILSADDVEKFKFWEYSLDDYIDENNICGDFEIDDSIIIFGYETPNHIQKEIGITIESGELICATGSGWYLYERVQ